MRSTPIWVVLALSACTTTHPVAPGGGSIPTASGHWTDTDLGVALDLHLIESEDGTVRGTGTLTLEELELRVTASGTRAYLNLDLEAEGFEDLKLLGWVLDSTHVSARLVSQTYEFYPRRDVSDASTNCVLRLTAM